MVHGGKILQPWKYEYANIDIRGCNVVYKQLCDAADKSTVPTTLSQTFNAGSAGRCQHEYVAKSGLPWTRETWWLCVLEPKVTSIKEKNQCREETKQSSHVPQGRTLLKATFIQHPMCVCDQEDAETIEKRVTRSIRNDTQTQTSQTRETQAMSCLAQRASWGRTLSMSERVKRYGVACMACHGRTSLCPHLCWDMWRSRWVFNVRLKLRSVSTFRISASRQWHRLALYLRTSRRIVSIATRRRRHGRPSESSICRIRWNRTSFWLRPCVQLHYPRPFVCYKRRNTKCDYICAWTTHLLKRIQNTGKSRENTRPSNFRRQTNMSVWRRCAWSHYVGHCLRTENTIATNNGDSNNAIWNRAWCKPENSLTSQRVFFSSAYEQKSDGIED